MLRNLKHEFHQTSIVDGGAPTSNNWRSSCCIAESNSSFAHPPYITLQHPSQLHSLKDKIGSNETLMKTPLCCSANIVRVGHKWDQSLYSINSPYCMWCNMWREIIILRSPQGKSRRLKSWEHPYLSKPTNCYIVLISRNRITNILSFCHGWNPIKIIKKWMSMSTFGWKYVLSSKCSFITLTIVEKWEKKHICFERGWERAN